MPYEDDLNKKPGVGPNTTPQYTVPKTNIESEVQYQKRQQRQTRTGLIILCIAVVAFVGGFIATLDNKTTNTAPTTTAATTTTDGSAEAAVAPAAGTANTTTAPAGTNEAAVTPATGTSAQTENAAAATTATSGNENPAAEGTPTTATSAATTPPVTENPKTYASEDSCRSATNGACRTSSGGWTSVNPAPDKTAVPEAVAPTMAPATDATGTKSTEENTPD